MEVIVPDGFNNTSLNTFQILLQLKRCARHTTLSDHLCSPDANGLRNDLVILGISELNIALLYILVCHIFHCQYLDQVQEKTNMSLKPQCGFGDFYHCFYGNHYGYCEIYNFV